MAYLFFFGNIRIFFAFLKYPQKKQRAKIYNSRTPKKQCQAAHYYQIAAGRGGNV